MFDGMGAGGVEDHSAFVAARRVKKPSCYAELNTPQKLEYNAMKETMVKLLRCKAFTLLRRQVREKIVKRFLQKLKNYSLDEKSVPEVASGVWNELQDTCGPIVIEPMSPVEELVRDVRRRYDEDMPRLAKVMIEDYLSKFHASDKVVVEILARDMWPEIKRALKL